MHIKKHLFILSATLQVFTLAGCTQYDFANENSNIETETYTELYTEYVTSTTEEQTVVISHNLEFENSPDSIIQEQTHREKATDSNIGVGSSNKLSYPSSGYTLITSTYSNNVLNVINTKRAENGLSAISISSSLQDDANIYAANMAFRNSLISTNTNNNASIFSSMSSKTDANAVTSTTSNICNNHPEILNKNEISIGIATSSDNTMYICIMAR